MTSLPVSRLIKVSVTLTPQAAQSQSLSTLLILGASTVIDVVERERSYSSIEEVAAQFGTSAPEYFAALLWFEQAPQPSTLMIGRWAKTDSAGQLVGGTLIAADQLMASWTGITDGSFAIAVDGNAAANITGLNFSAETNLNGVASVIDAAINAAGADCVYDANFQRFVFTSQTTGATSEIDFLTAAGSGTDIKAKVAGTEATNAYVADGIAAEEAVDAVALMDERFGQQWYAVTLLEGDDDDTLAIAAFVEASDTKHLQGVSTQDTGVLSAVDTSNIAYLLKQQGYSKTVVQYSSHSLYAVCSLLGRILTVDYDGNDTVITLMYKQEPGITAEQLTTTQVNALEGFNCNVFVAYNNDTAIIEPGKVSSGDFVDEITGADWLAVTIMTAVYNLLYTSPTKIPQTDAGVHLITTTIEQVCAQGVTNGLLAPGTWNSAGFGILKQGDFIVKGFYVYAQPVALQNQSNRAARKAPPIQVAAKLAGAVHTVPARSVLVLQRTETTGS